MSSHLSVISTGNEELDTRLGGGLPHPSLIVIEGDNGTGKTSLVLQFVYGALQQGLRTVLLTTETTAVHILRQAKNITFDLYKYYLSRQLEVYSAHIGSSRWDREWSLRVSAKLASFVRSIRNTDLIVIDSITPILTQMQFNEAATLISLFRRETKRGITIILTLHPGLVRNDVLSFMKASSDVYFKLGLADIGGKQVKVLSVIKIRGAPMPAETTIAFDIDPAFGIKIVPVVVAHA